MQNSCSVAVPQRISGSTDESKTSVISVWAVAPNHKMPPQPISAFGEKYRAETHQPKNTMNPPDAISYR